MELRVKSFADQLELAFKQMLVVRNLRVFRNSFRRLSAIRDVTS